MRLHYIAASQYLYFHHSEVQCRTKVQFVKQQNKTRSYGISHGSAAVFCMTF